MDSKVDYEVSTRENIYFLLSLIFSLGLYALLIWLFFVSIKSDSQYMVGIYIAFIYMILLAFGLFIRFGIVIGRIKGNSVKLSKNQFPDIYQMVEKQSELLGLRSVPNVYILQSGGALNAFAARFMGYNYIVLYSEIVEAALEQDKNILEFIIGHELGHIKRNHMIKKLLLFPSALIPFLALAYSRACEYTCDAIGFGLNPAGVKGGLLMLASGKMIYKKVNVDEFIAQNETDRSFWKWFAEKSSSHPNLTKRLGEFADRLDKKPVIEKKPLVEKREEDHSRYFPQ